MEPLQTKASTITIAAPEDFADEASPLVDKPNNVHLLQAILTGPSIVLLVNNTTGAGMLELPWVFQQAGVVPTVIAIISVAVLAGITALRITDLLSSLKSNEGFQLPVFYLGLFQYFFGDVAYHAISVAYFISLLTSACACIIYAAEAVDSFIAVTCGSTFALQLYPSPSFMSWSYDDGDDDTPFQNHSGALFVTLGYLLISLAFAPLGTMTLRDNMHPQIFSFVLLVGTTLVFTATSCVEGLSFSNVPIVGSDFSSLMGVVVFNFTYTICIPSWLHEKHPQVSPTAVVYASSAVSACLYIAFGLFSALAYSKVSDNILDTFTTEGSDVSRYCALLFSICIIGLGVPILCVLMAKNLAFGACKGGKGLCSPPWARIWGAYGPYLLSWMLYGGSTVLDLISWVGLSVLGTVAFVCPLYVALVKGDLSDRMRLLVVVVLLCFISATVWSISVSL